VKLRGRKNRGNDLAGSENFLKSPVPTRRSVLRSNTLACRALKWIGTKLLCVFASRETKQGNVKFVGARGKAMGSAVAQAPVAATKGVLPLNEKLGTRGITKARMMPTL